MLKSSHITLMTTDMDRSIGFYESLGMKLDKRWGDRYAHIKGPDISIGIHPSDKKTHSSGTISIGFSVDDLDAGMAMLTKLNIPFKAEKDDFGTLVHFSDPDGTTLYLVKAGWE